MLSYIQNSFEMFPQKIRTPFPPDLKLGALSSLLPHIETGCWVLLLKTQVGWLQMLEKKGELMVVQTFFKCKFKMCPAVMF